MERHKGDSTRTFVKKPDPNVFRRKDFIEIIWNAQRGRDEYLHKYNVADIFDSFIHILSRAMVEGETVDFRGFGSFFPIRNGFKYTNKYNPQTGESTLGYKFFHNNVFKPSKELIGNLNGGDNSVYERYFSYDSDTIRDSLGEESSD